MKRSCANVMSLTCLLVAMAGFLAWATAQDARPDAESNRTNAVTTQIDGPPNAAEDAVRFEAIDVFIDSADQKLAAWQFELTASSDGVEIAGIEGGEHPAFQTPPYYDPRAIQSNRVVVGAFSTADDLPGGKSRVARIHVQLQGPGQKEFRSILKVSATAGGTEIPARLSIQKTETP